MGNCVSISIPFDSCMNKVSQWQDEKGGYIHNLEKNLTSLETTMEELKAKRDDLSRRVTREEDRGLKRLAEIQVWLARVETIENRVSDLVSVRNVELERLCLCGFCSKSLMSSYRYGRRVFLTLREVEKLKSRVFELVCDQTQTPEVQERQLQPLIVGQETMLEKAWKHLREDEVGILGLYGMGGVGKTTLLTQLNNKFSDERCGFDYVIWVVVSKELQVEKIQDEIAQKVCLRGEEWNQKDESQKGVYLYNFLKKKRFVLFLDDIWQKVDLSKTGVPFPTRQNRCKVAFTTRSQDVCAHMGVEDPMEVKCLEDNEAFDLFQKKVGHVTLGSDPEIPELARIVARKCRGLPLALNVIGETMSCKRTVEEWRHAIDVLTSYAIKFSGMEDEILPVLKYSYDNLKGEQVKSCFLYCALFPEDGSILSETLIEYWICEGIIDGSEGIERAENKGYDIIGSLVRASLLMKWLTWDQKHIVRMHDVIREMALWIASDLGIQKEAFIVHAGVGLHVMPKVKNWNVVRRMSLMKNKIHHLAGNPECLQLTTLLLQDTTLESISGEFFKSMPKLVVLDLSKNQDLIELPDSMWELGSLQYLNLSETGIRVLPMRLLQGLKKLLQLSLDETRMLSSIAGISNLHNLKVLNVSFSGFSWDLSTVEELETLEHLETLTVGICTRSLKPFFSSQRLMSRTRFLKIEQSYVESSAKALTLTKDKLCDFSISDCDLESCGIVLSVALRVFCIQGCNISEIKMGGICNESKTVSLLHNPRNTCFSSLSIVSIRECIYLRELTVLMFAPNLTSLSVFYSTQLEDVINKEKACEVEESGVVPFPKLTSLMLSYLPELKSIFWSPLPFPCLKEITVIGCPNLKKLPLNSQSGKKGKFGFGPIVKYGEKEWIESVEWEDEATKTRFLSSCKKAEPSCSVSWLPRQQEVPSG